MWDATGPSGPGVQQGEVAMPEELLAPDKIAVEGVQGLLVAPQVLIPIDSPGAQTSVGAAIQAHVASNLALVTDVGMAGTADTTWAPLASARLIGRWPLGALETSVLRGTAAPRTKTDTAFVSSRDREAVRAQLQPLAGLTLVALTSSSRPRPTRSPTTRYWTRSASRTTAFPPGS
jgi:hypothetical protein